MKKLIFGFDDVREAAARDWGLLIVRIGFGLTMALAHGWGKAVKLFSNPSQFADPFGLGPEVTLFVAAFGEFVCALLIVVGLATRAATLPLIVTMVTAIFVIHADDPWQKKEFALLYLVPFVALLVAGAGRLSLDNALRRK